MVSNQCLLSRKIASAFGMHEHFSSLPINVRFVLCSGSNDFSLIDMLIWHKHVNAEEWRERQQKKLGGKNR